MPCKCTHLIYACLSSISVLSTNPSLQSLLLCWKILCDSICEANPERLGKWMQRVWVDMCVYRVLAFCVWVDKMLISLKSVPSNILLKPCIIFYYKINDIDLLFFINNNLETFAQKLPLNLCFFPLLYLERGENYEAFWWYNVWPRAWYWAECKHFVCVVCYKDSFLFSLTLFVVKL